MKAIYKNKSYTAEFEKKTMNVVLYSYTKDDGFHDYVDPWGNRAEDFFSKVVSQVSLSYIWRISYNVQFKNRWYHLHTAINPLAISENHYEVILDFTEGELAEQLGFERTDKFYYTKRLYREDIEALKVIETPLGRFSDRGLKETILVGDELDEYLEEIVKGEL
ncbi:hypothetical protein [Streptococcus fryi]